MKGARFYQFRDTGEVIATLEHTRRRCVWTGAHIVAVVDRYGARDESWHVKWLRANARRISELDAIMAEPELFRHLPLDCGPDAPMREHAVAYVVQRGQYATADAARARAAQGDDVTAYAILYERDKHTHCYRHQIARRAL